MSKYIVCVFDSEKAAYQGLRAAQELDYEGSIAVYEGVIISKDANGKVQIKDAEEQGPIGTLAGMLVGGLVGVISGPAGLAVGAAVGSLSGLVVDIYNAGVGEEFLDDVAAALKPGNYALVGEVEEGWTTPLDTRIEALGGTVYRSWRIDVEDEQIARDIEATNRELDELDEEWDQASAEAKAKLNAKKDAAKAKLKALDDRAKEKEESLKKQAKGKIDKLNGQIAKAKEDMKKKLEKTRNELKADYEKRAAKLKKSRQLAAEALK